MPKTNEQHYKAAQLIYDPANSVQGDDANTSVVANIPEAVQLEGLDATTTASVQVRVHKDASWIEHTLVDGNVETAKLITFDAAPNFLRVVRTGAANCKAFIQRGA